MEMEVQTDQASPAPVSHTPLPTLALATISLHYKSHMRESRAFPMRSPRLFRLNLSPRHNQRCASHTPTPIRQMSQTPGPGVLPPLLALRKDSPQRAFRQVSIRLPLLEKVPRRLVRIRRVGDWDLPLLDKF